MQQKSEVFTKMLYGLNTKVDISRQNTFMSVLTMNSFQKPEEWKWST